jgi:hypothetical protein
MTATKQFDKLAATIIYSRYALSVVKQMSWKEKYAKNARIY